MSTETRTYTLDPVTFEVLKNAFITTVDQMAEQILRTCHSFVIYARDFSSALCDKNGDTIMQGSQDIAVHVGTLRFVPGLDVFNVFNSNTVQALQRMQNASTANNISAVVALRVIRAGVKLIW